MRERWTDEDDAILRRHYQSIPAERLAFLLGRSLDAVQKRGFRLGLSMPRGFVGVFGESYRPSRVAIGRKCERVRERRIRP